MSESDRPKSLRGDGDLARPLVDDLRVPSIHHPNLLEVFKFVKWLCEVQAVPEGTDRVNYGERMFAISEGGAVKRHVATASATASRRSPALRSRTIGVGLLAVRSRAAVKRALAGQPLTARDTAELTDVRRVIDQAAEAIRYGVAGTAPAARQITSVGLALSTVAGPTQQLDREAMAAHLSSLVAELDRLIAGEQPNDPEAVPAFLNGLMRAADRDTAQSGETLVRRG